MLEAHCPPTSNLLPHISPQLGATIDGAVKHPNLNAHQRETTAYTDCVVHHDLVSHDNTYVDLPKGRKQTLDSDHVELTMTGQLRGPRADLEAQKAAETRASNKQSIAE